MSRSEKRYYRNLWIQFYKSKNNKYRLNNHKLLLKNPCNLFNFVSELKGNITRIQQFGAKLFSQVRRHRSLFSLFQTDVQLHLLLFSAELQRESICQQAFKPLLVEAAVLCFCILFILSGRKSQGPVVPVHCRASTSL